MEATMPEKIKAQQSKRLGLLTIPGAAISLLPILACSLCWPAYAALLSSLGLGFLGNSAYLLPLTGALLAVAVAGLGLQIKNAGYGPFPVCVGAGGAGLAGQVLVGLHLANHPRVGLVWFALRWVRGSR